MSLAEPIDLHRIAVAEFLTSNVLRTIATAGANWNLDRIIGVRACIIIINVGPTSVAATIERKEFTLGIDYAHLPIRLRD
jgi:hypothetical protein